ncbi:methyl-accepting chemotaxis protein [Paenibacillus methanolicus]|uniref:Methyl-accepting chemotaxis protein n=1 Tax=Paenibacillus methanolicus TaxID=582686 RepID=A0A5S5CE30_9BACL|nr:methyl-accepting chemotaxis protein [Paenibacillus methanolicus]TYP76752.1 methyl-accepting chemotaxis protein [Paenibacillus methanolicus]
MKKRRLTFMPQWKKIGLRKIKRATLHPSKSVGARVFLAFFLSTMTFVLSLGCVSYQMSKRTIANNAELSIRQTLEQTAEKLDLTLQRFDDSLQQSLFGSDIQDLARRGALAGTDARELIVIRQKLTSALGNWVFANPGALGVALISKSGDMEPVSSGMIDKGILQAARNAAWFKEAIASRKALWQAGEGGEGDSRPSKRFSLIKALPGPSGNGYVVMAEIKTDFLTDALTKIDLEGQAVAKLLSADHVLLAASSEQEAYLPSEAGAARALTVTSAVSLSQWQLSIAIPMEVLMQDARMILSTTYSMAVIVAIIATLIGIWMVRSIASPLRNMKGLMQEAASGNLKVSMPVRGRDEIGELSRSFNGMMAQMDELVLQTRLAASEVLHTASELGEASYRTSAAAMEIAGATEEIAIGAASLAEEVARQMRQFMEVNRTIGVAAGAVGQASERGIGQLNALESETADAGRKTAALAVRVDRLQSTALSVLRVLEVMQGIAKQTNILSLNATIEAARAGAAGKGFIVVADEIRELAAQSRRSIDLVKNTADEIMSEVSATVDALAEVSPLFASQREAVAETSEIFRQVHAQMRHFVDQLGTVTDTVGQLVHAQHTLSVSMGSVSAVAEQSSATTQEVASLTADQQRVSDRLVELSTQLELVSANLRDKLAVFDR